MHRTQIYIEENLFQRLSRLSREKKTTISELLRRAYFDPKVILSYTPVTEAEII